MIPSTNDLGLSLQKWIEFILIIPSQFSRIHFAVPWTWSSLESDDWPLNAVQEKCFGFNYMIMFWNSTFNMLSVWMRLTSKTPFFISTKNGLLYWLGSKVEENRMIDEFWITLFENILHVTYKKMISRFTMNCQHRVHETKSAHIYVHTLGYS